MTQQQQHQQQQQPEGSGPESDDKPAAIAELQQLAYCSLASSVVSAMVNSQQQGADHAGLLMTLAMQLVQAAKEEALCRSSIASSCVEQGSLSMGQEGADPAPSAAAAAAAGAAGGSTAVVDGGNSTVAGISTSSGSMSTRGAGWGLAASLAAATAAAAYASHVGAPDKDHGLSTTSTTGLPAGGASDESRGDSSNLWCRITTAISSIMRTINSGPVADSSTQASSSGPIDSLPAGVDGPIASGLPGESSSCGAHCGVCTSVTQLFITLRCLERGWVMPTPSGPASSAVLTQAAQQSGTTLQQYLQHQLLALAWRHPVPGVCGNVLCGRLQGPSAVGAVWGLVGPPPYKGARTLCGGCRAAWYCCEECQEEAWEGHRAVCGGRGK
jgi:hypothetical protein